MKIRIQHFFILMFVFILLLVACQQKKDIIIDDAIADAITDTATPTVEPTPTKEVEALPKEQNYVSDFNLPVCENALGNKTDAKNKFYPQRYFNSIELNFFAEYADKVYKSKNFTSIYKFSDADEDEKTVVMWCSEKMTNLRVVEISCDEKGIFADKKTLFQKDTILPDEAFEYTTNITYGIPKTKIMFTDERAVEHSFILSFETYGEDFIALDDLPKIDLVNNAKVITWGGTDYFAHSWGTTIAVEYENSDILLKIREYEGHIPIISPNKAKLAYLIGFHVDDGSIPYIFDVATKQNIVPHIDCSDRFSPSSIVWLDDNYLLLIMRFSDGTVSRGGDVYSYNVNTGASKKIITTDNNNWLTQPEKLEIIDDHLKLDIFQYTDSNYTENILYTENIPLEKIFELINSDEPLVINSR